MLFDRDIHGDLKNRLISGEFEHGAKLRAEVLRTEYGCSASTVREALFRLSTVGLAEFEEQRGFRVPQSPGVHQGGVEVFEVDVRQAPPVRNRPSTARSKPPVRTIVPRRADHHPP